MPNRYNRICLKSILILSAVTFSIGVTSAQTIKNDRVILTWRANNFYPANYQGKALATPNTPITISAELTRNNKLLDLAQANFIWYVDEKFLTSGRAIKEILFPVKKLNGDDYFVRVKIDLGGEQFETAIHIPVSGQGLIIESPHPRQLVKTDAKIGLEAIPYFFNVPSIKDLIFSWQVNDKDLVGGSDNKITINIGRPITQDQRTIKVVGSVQNRINPLESARTNLNLTVY